MKLKGLGWRYASSENGGGGATIPNGDGDDSDDKEVGEYCGTSSHP